MSFRLALVTMVSLVAYLALAIAGAGGPARFFSHPPLTALAVVTVLFGIVALFSQGHVGSGVREDRSNCWVIAAFGGLGLVEAFVPAYADRHNILTFGGEGVRWIGVVVYALGGALRMIPVFALGRRFSGLVAIQPGHTLKTDGIYRLIRHPSYLGLVVNAVGWALAFRSGVGLLIAAAMLAVTIARIRAEERLLAETFGADYDAWRARTWRLVPYLY